MADIYCYIGGVTNLISASVNSSHGSDIASAQFSCVDYAGTIGDSIEIDMGYSNLGGHRVLFKGFVKEIQKKYPEGLVYVTCADFLSRAADSFIVSKSPSGSYANGGPFTFGGDGAGIKIEDLVLKVFEVGALKLSDYNTDFDYDTSNFILAKLHSGEVNVTGCLDYIRFLADIIGWKVWYGTEGVHASTVHFKNRKPYPMNGNHPEQPGYGTDPVLKTINKDVVTTASYTTDEKDLRNRIVVWGATGKDGQPVFAEAKADADEGALPVGFYKTVLVSAAEVIDDQDMATKAASYNLQFLNHTSKILTCEVLGDPDLEARKVVRCNIAPGDNNTKYYILSCDQNFSRGGYTTTLSLRRDVIT